MSSAKQDFLSPVGRMVQGNPFEKQTKDMQGRPLTIKTGASAGQPTQRYFCAVAFAKNDPAWPAFYQLLFNAARTGFPTLFDAQGNCLSRDFSWKVADGDSTYISKPGETPNAQKEGFAGHWVVKFSSSFPPRVFYTGKYAAHEAITDPNVLRRGYYVRIAGTVEGNGQSDKPGIYVNLSMVEFAGIGPEITSGPDANQIFGGNAAALPQGAQPLPMNAGMGNGQPGMMPPGMQAPQQQYAPPPQQQYQPPQQQYAQPGVAPGAMPTFAPGAGPSMMPGGAPGAMPGMQPTMHPNNPAAGMAQPPQQQYAPPTMVQPHPGILQGPGMTPPPQQQYAQPGAVPGVPMAQPGQMPGMMPPPAQQYAPPPVVHQMTAAAGQWTYEQLIAGGHTDASLRAQGLML